jgi:hypothetical protein
MAVGTRQQESKYKRAFGNNQTTASSKKSTPSRGFSKFRLSYCILLTAICPLVSLGAKNYAAILFKAARNSGIVNRLPCKKMERK